MKEAPVVESLDSGTRELSDKCFHCGLGLTAAPGCGVHHPGDVSDETFEAGPPKHPPLLPRLLQVDNVGEVGQAGGTLLTVPSPMWILVDQIRARNQWTFWL